MVNKYEVKGDEKAGKPVVSAATVAPLSERARGRVSDHTQVGSSGVGNLSGVTNTSEGCLGPAAPNNDLVGFYTTTGQSPKFKYNKRD